MEVFDLHRQEIDLLIADVAVVPSPSDPCIAIWVSAEVTDKQSLKLAEQVITICKSINLLDEKTRAQTVEYYRKKINKVIPHPTDAVRQIEILFSPTEAHPRAFSCKAIYSLLSFLWKLPVSKQVVVQYVAQLIRTAFVPSPKPSAPPLHLAVSSIDGTPQEKVHGAAVHNVHTELEARLNKRPVATPRSTITSDRRFFCAPRLIWRPWPSATSSPSSPATEK